jgi:hypothetical protein
LSPNDLWASMFQHLNIDYQTNFMTPSGRPLSILPFGSPIRELW